jgi:hypothetical protein
MFGSFLVRFCFIAAAVVLHCSLLFCTDSHCVYPVNENLLIARAALYVPSEFFNMIPVELKTLQLLAQWLIVIEAVFVIHIGFAIIRKIIILIFEITFATIVLAAAYYYYCRNSIDPRKTESVLREMLHVAKNLINLLHWILAKIK